MPSRLFVVTGSAGSELSWTAAVFAALGASCGDEDVFHTAAFERGGTLYWPPTFAGDASWYAAPILGKLPSGSVVIHQVRHPLATIHALTSSGFFDRETPSRDFAQDFVPETRRNGPLTRVMRFWLEWHRMIEAAADYDDLVYRRYRLEAASEYQICEQLALLGLQRDAGTVRRVVAKLGGGPDPGEGDLAWEDLPDGKLRDELVAASARYGYEQAA